ncbi:NAD(P)/FAD-dependent oxidoreductase [Pseudomonas typographi]|uniref:NAD(P)/FAD-dependent oxidoreductase n=1 Tax=Pseudomonas typographi TaxID=2715964 RepID=A0ABR7YXI3_9PSED|nr:NAD(P)/FAD-dependent oxidoreductase [Pseudomonas typographi]MBD1551014.1 NAD(P)/FAD-dependent oxidoreductase [Pseudomonas typographi]MBD1587928.1 NAD(P)/FAD-dependent oxidoreductase [Pseudomonas typographi]MBD1597916.1 NAD(P)/FAD-dependent oxidoreductase [Pseudomonas typographi]
MTHRIVIVGGGAGGLELATRLGKTFGKKGTAHVTLVDANLTHIWKPLLHEVAAGSLNAHADELNYLAQAKWNHFEFQLGCMVGLDREAKTITLRATLDEQGAELVPQRTLAYDTLVIAVGSTTNDFGTQGAAEHCLFLDTRQQAERFHQQLLNAYLRAHANLEAHEQEITVAIVGAGATGVELAAELHNAALEMAAYGLGRIKPENLRITLIEASPRVLPALPERIGKPVHTTLEKLGVKVMVGAPVSQVTAEQLVTQDGTVVPAAMKVWAAGIRAPAFLQDIAGLETNRINQLVVRPTLQTSRDDDIFAFGDCAACPQPGSDRNVPPRAQAAHQQASMLAKSLKARLNGGALPEYRYKDYGSLVSLSRFSAVGNLMGNLTGNVMLEGWLARMFYVSLYRMHQMALYGLWRTGLAMLGSRIGRGTEPRLKLH